MTAVTGSLPARSPPDRQDIATGDHSGVSEEQLSEVITALRLEMDRFDRTDILQYFGWYLVLLL